MCGCGGHGHIRVAPRERVRVRRRGGKERRTTKKGDARTRAALNGGFVIDGEAVFTFVHSIRLHNN